MEQGLHVPIGSGRLLDALGGFAFALHGVQRGRVHAARARAPPEQAAAWSKTGSPDNGRAAENTDPAQAAERLAGAAAKAPAAAPAGEPAAGAEGRAAHAEPAQAADRCDCAQAGTVRECCTGAEQPTSAQHKRIEHK